MKIQQWLGYNEDASRYILRAGELSVLNNLQSRRPGMLITRKGLQKLFGLYDDRSIYGIYRRATILGEENDFILLQKVRVRRELSAEQIAAREEIYEYIWEINRLVGNESHVIASFPVANEGETDITNFSLAEDRHGRTFLFFGHGLTPQVYFADNLSNSSIDMGIAAPKAAPTVTPTGKGSFIESVDVRFPGGSYYEAPELYITGGDPSRDAKLQALVKNGQVVGVEVVDGGSNFTTPPKITASSRTMGVGFRAIGVVSSATQNRQIYGFSPDKPATIYDTSPYTEPDANETYGTKNGTEDQQIIYGGHQAGVEKTVLNHASGSADVELENVDGIALGNKVSIFPAGAPFNTSFVYVTAISGNTITLSQAWPDAVVTNNLPSTYRMSFNQFQREYADATYDENRRRYTATVPINWNVQSGAGKEAFATLEFSPLPLGYAINSNSVDESVEVTVSNWMTAGNGGPNYYGQYWDGSDQDAKNSAENSVYMGLQASGTEFTHGFSGTVGGRRADVYWPNYNFISVWVCTGNYSSGRSQWRRVNVPVQQLVDELPSGATTVSQYIQFRLPPTAAGRKVSQIKNATVNSNLESADELPDAVQPEIRIYLTPCPDSWLINDEFSRPTEVKENSPSRLSWVSSKIPRPFVNIAPEGAEIDESTVQIIDPGSGWGKDTLFAFRLYQANPYAQKTDYNTSTVEPTIPGYHDIRSESKYVEFRLRATAPDDQTPHGPPHTLVRPVLCTAAGEGWQANETAEVYLNKRNMETGAILAAPVIRWSTDLIHEFGTATRKVVTDVTILSRGQNYFAEPTILSRGGGTGYGLSVEPIIESGRITDVRIIDSGQDYEDAPELYTEARPAKLTAIMRPTMRGRYRCAYRFADRSMTVVRDIVVERIDGDNRLYTDDYDGLEADMVLDGDSVPWYSRLKSVNRGELELDQELDDEAFPAGHSVVWQTNTSENSKSGVLVLEEPQELAPSEYWESPNGEYRLTLNPDRQVVLVKKRVFFDRQRGIYNRILYDTVLWSAGTSDTEEIGEPHRLVFDDGHLYLIDGATGEVVWEQGVGNSGGTLELGNDGNLAIYTARSKKTVTVRDFSKQVVYSDLSPIADVDAGPNAERAFSSKMVWELGGIDPPARADLVELWRTSGDQSLVYYRVNAYGIPSAEGVEIVGEDTLSDEELFDSDRPFYAAMPIVLPNGNLNAYRFGLPKKNLSAAVAFQDRLWMAVSTDGEGANTLYYSEFDEFESVPDVNELPIQQNQKNTDVITALVPFGSMLLAMQHTHTYSIAYNTDPSVDATIQMLSHRGVLHQRCWDIHENILYAADESGIYSMSRAGEVQDISLPIRDFFVSEVIDFSKRETFFLQTDPRTHILRFFCTLKPNATSTPSLALCYDIQARSWWTESYPNSFTSAGAGRPSVTQVNTIILGAVDGNMYEITGYSDHSNGCLNETEVRDGGSGYRRAPTITVPNVTGAKVQGVVSEGRLVDVVVQDTGWYASWGIGILAEDGSPLAGHDGKEIKGVEYAPIKLDVGPPEAGGRQAEAYAHFAVTPEVRRFATVSLGEDFVRLESTRVSQFEPDREYHLNTESLLGITTEDGTNIRSEPQPVEMGMEVFGEYIPLNSYVSRIDGKDIYISHPDGSPARILFGAERTNQEGTSEGYLEYGGTRSLIKFRKPFHTNIPFRAATGVMPLVNEENSRGGDSLIDRSVSLVYTPTDDSKEVEILERFNGRDELRPNVMRRQRGGTAGFHHRQDSASTVIDIGKYASDLGFSPGTAKATFASRAYADMTGEDQHIQVEIYGRPTKASKFERVNFFNPDDTPEPDELVLHSLTVNGVVE